MRNYSTAFYEPELSNSENVESWEEHGSKDMRARAYDKWKDMLSEYQTPAIDSSVLEALTDFVDRREKRITRCMVLEGIRYCFPGFNVCDIKTL